MEQVPPKENIVAGEKDIQYEQAEPISDRREAAKLLYGGSDKEVQLLKDGTVHIAIHSFAGRREEHVSSKYYRLNRAVFDYLLTAGYLRSSVAPGVSDTWHLAYAKAREDEELFPGESLR